MIGIKSYGGYIPRLRLNRMSIVQTMGWFAPAIIAVAQGERSFCNWDEDSLTMAVAAARDCLKGMDKNATDAVYLCSTTLPFADRLNAGIMKDRPEPGRRDQRRRRHRQHARRHHRPAAGPGRGYRRGLQTGFGGRQRPAHLQDGPISTRCGSGDGGGLADGGPGRRRHRRVPGLLQRDPRLHRPLPRLGPGYRLHLGGTLGPGRRLQPDRAPGHKRPVQQTGHHHGRRGQTGVPLLLRGRTEVHRPRSWAPRPKRWPAICTPSAARPARPTPW